MPPPPRPAAAAKAGFSPEALSAAGLSAERLSLPTLQDKMKRDPEGYVMELQLLRRHFDSSLYLFRHEAALRPAVNDPTASKELGDLALFLAHVAPFYPQELASLASDVAGLLRDAARSLPAALREHLVQALVLLVNRKLVDLEDTLDIFMELQVLSDHPIRKLAFSHVVHSISRMNKKHKNDVRNRKLQNILFSILQGEEELRAKRSLIIVCDLHRRRVWFDDRVANAICTACFHPSSKIMIAAISFLLGYENAEEDDDDSDASSGEDDAAQELHVVLNKQDVYKAHHKGTIASKRKKKAKLQRVIRNMKRKQRRASEDTNTNYYSPLTYLNDPQGFAEKLFSRLQNCNERFEVRMMMLKVISRTVGLHRLILLNLYPYLQRYVQPHQRDVTTLLAAAVQACHDMVPPDAVEPLFKQIVNQFVNDRSRPEAIAVGLNVVREICLRMPLLMSEDLLQDLVLYKKTHEKAVSTAARSLITLFRELCPSLLVKKDRGRPIDPKAKPKAFGEVKVASDVPGAELLQESNFSGSGSSDGESDEYNSDNSPLDDEKSGTKEVAQGSEECFEEIRGFDGNHSDEEEGSDNAITDSEELGSDSDMDESIDSPEASSDDEEEDDDTDSDSENENVPEKCNGKSTLKRKLTDCSGEIIAADVSLRALKRQAAEKGAQLSSEGDGIYSNEDFQRIKRLKARREAKLSMASHGLLKGTDSKVPTFKLPSSEELSLKRVDPSKLEVNIRRKLSKDERLAMVKAGREERGEYKSRTAVKQKKTGGLSNRQKEHKKRMPLVAKRVKAARSRKARKEKQKHAGKQFRGRKAWK